jgi:hypothetical protein
VQVSARPDPTRPAEQMSTFDPQDRRTCSAHGHGEVRKHSAIGAHKDGSGPSKGRIS